MRPSSVVQPAVVQHLGGCSRRRLVVGTCLVLVLVVVLEAGTPFARSRNGSVCGAARDPEKETGFDPDVRPVHRRERPADPRLRGQSWISAPPPVAFFAALKGMPADGDPITEIRQSNAVRSWKATHLRAEVFLFGDDTVKAFARRHGVTYIANVKTTPSGVPLFSDMLRMTKERTAHGLLCFSNADIMFMTGSFGEAVESLCSIVPPDRQLLMIGQRFDVPVNDTRLLFDSITTTRAQLVALEAHPQSFLQNVMYKDYFVFSRDLWPTAAGRALPLAIGRARIDDWIVHSAMASSAVVADATPVLRAYHQIHNYKHVAGGKAAAWGGADAQENIRLAGDLSVLGDINRCPYQLRFTWSGAVSVYRNYGATVVKFLFDVGFFRVVHAIRDRLGWWMLLGLAGAVSSALAWWWRCPSRPSDLPEFKSR